MRAVLRVVVPEGQKEARAVRRRVQRVAYRQLREVAFGGPVTDVQVGTIVPSIRNAQNEKRPWSEAELAWLHAHPELTSGQAAAHLPGRTAQAVRHARMRFGRFGHDGRREVCFMCRDRPVWADSREAVSRGLCKACFLRAREQEAREEALHNRVRQVEFRARRRRERDGGGA